MALSVGTRLGAYEVTGVLGAGGMGEVYRARDTKLGREVALKVLPETFAADPDRLARFAREAQLLASLSHPHIAAIYGLEDSGDRRALVLELVEGPTLADRIAEGPMPIEDALRVARQIAEALETAHEKGIVHRDLKPANVKLTPSGQVKVLDFGLARLNVSNASNVSNDPNVLTMSPTVLSPAMMTHAGVILGTAAYMAPEQAKGREVDRRADIWAFGCVLFEMLAGRAVFVGESVSDIVSEVLKTEPDWPRLPASTPGHVRRLLRRCLQKDPARRLHHIADARLDLDEAITAEEPVSPAPARSTRARVARALPWAVALVAIAVAGWALARPPADAAEALARLELNTPAGVELFTATSLSLAISPDGSRIAFVGSQGGARFVYVRALDQFEARPLRGSDGATTCFFSADGRSVGLIDAGGVIRTIDLASGTVSTVTGDANFISGVAWSDRNQIVFVRGGALWQVMPGAAPAPLLTLEGGRELATPAFLPGGEALLFSAISGDEKRRIEALVIATGERRTIVEDATLPRYVESGHLVFYRGAELFAAPFDPGALRVTGPAVKMLDLPLFAGAVPDLDVSASGTLVYAPLTAQSRLVWVSRQGAAQPLNDELRPYMSPRLSPDTATLVVQAGDLWIHDLRRTAFTRLAPTDSVGFPIWTPDGRQVVFKTSMNLSVRNADGGGQSQVLPGTAAFDYPASMTPDGRTLVMLRSSQKTSFDVYTIQFPGGGELTPILTTPAYEGGARLSTDGRWLVYVSNDSGRNEVYLRPFPGPDRRLPVSTDGGTQPSWDRRGRFIYYRAGDRMMAVEVTAGADAVLSEPRLLFEGQYAFGAGITIANYDVAPDGQRFVMIKDESTAGRLNVVLNWREELKRLVPPK